MLVKITCKINYVNFQSSYKAGAQPETFWSRQGFVKLGHFDKNSRKNSPAGKNLEVFFLYTVKTTFWMANLT